jgi:alkylhydroperoxidase/carboxymuconolactone decarboxylase family protein YurZ
MEYEPKKTLEEFKRLMVCIQKEIPQQYQALMGEKKEVLKEAVLPEKTKWLLLLVASVTEKCPVCVARSVEHCLEAGWSKKEILEACMVAVLVGGSSVMTFVTLVEKAIEDFNK